MATVRELVTVLRYKLDESGLRQYVRGAKEAARNVQRAGRAAGSELAGGMREADKAVSNFNRHIRGGVRLSRKMGEQWKRLRGYALAAGAVAVGAFGVKASRNSAQFEQQLQDVGNTANLTDKQIKALRASVVDLGKKTGQSSDDVVAGLSTMVAAGLSVPDAIAAIGSVSKAATAESANVEDLARAAFTAMDTLGIKSDDLGQTLDTMAQAGKMGNVELKDMAPTLPAIASGFAGIHMKGREAVATMTAAFEVARKGAPNADVAATNLRNFVSAITSPAMLKRAQENFGVDLYAVVLKAQKDGANVFEAVMSKIKDMTGGDAKKLGMLTSNIRSLRFLRAFFQHQEDYKEIKDAALNAHDVVQKDFVRMMATRQQRMKNLAHSWDNFSKNAGMAINTVVAYLADMLIPVVNALGKHVYAVLAIVTAIGATAAFVILEKSLTAVAGSVRGVIAGLRLMAAASWASVGPYLAIGAALLAIYVIGKDVYKWITGQDSVMGKLVGKVGKWKLLLDPISKMARKIWKQLVSVGHAVAGIVRDMGSSVAQLFGMANGWEVIKTIASFVVFLVGHYLYAALHLVSGIITVVGDLFEAIRSTLVAIVALFTGDWKTAGDALADGFKHGLDALIHLWDALLNFIGDAFGIEDLAKKIDAWLKGAFEAAVGYVQKLIDKITELKGAKKSIAHGIVAGVELAFGNPKNAGALLQGSTTKTQNVSHTDSRSTTVNVHGVPVDKAASVGRAASDGVRKGFGPYSPPTVEQGAW